MLHNSKSSTKMLDSKVKYFATNLNSSLVSFVTHDDREYMTAPCVALVPGVLNGDLVTLDAVANTYPAWNGRPVVVDHPYASNGNSTSANDPAVLSHAGIGQVWYADINADRLRVQVWIDVEKAKRLGGDAQRVVDMVKGGEPLEVSTGYWANLRPMEGVYNGEAYSAVTEMIIPDHLAMLPNAVGACNWGDGCGIPRVMKQEGVDVDERTLRRVMMDTLKGFLPKQNMTVSDRTTLLQTLIEREMEAEGVDIYGWYLVDVEDNYAVIGVRNTYRRKAFTEEDGNISLTGEWEDVSRNTTYQPMTTNKGMCKECAAVVAQAEGDEEPVTPDPGETEPVTPEPVAPEPEPQPDEEESPETEEEPEEEEEDEVKAQAADTLKTFLAELGTSEDEVKAALESRRNRRTELYETIKANSELTDDVLNQTPDAVLEQMAAHYAVEVIAGEGVDNSQGNAGSFVRGMPTRQQQKRTTMKRPEVLKRVG